LIDGLTLIEVIYQDRTDGVSQQAKHKAKTELFIPYYVWCSVTGDRIGLSELNYWNIDKQIAYSRPEIIPLSHFYPHLAPSGS
jgi:hypothetical protein